MYRCIAGRLYPLNIITMFLVMFCSLNAQEPVLITDELTSISLENSLIYYEDETGNLEIQDLMALPESKFKKLPGKVNMGFSQSSFWVRFHIKNEKMPSKRPTCILKLTYPEIEYIDFFQISAEGELVQSVITGNMRPVITRQRQDEHIIFIISVPRNEIQTIYLKIKTDTPVYLDFKILKIDHYLQENQRSALYIGLFIGILLLAIGYYSTLYFKLRDKSFLYLVLAGIALLFDYLASSQFAYLHLWPDYTYWNKISVPFFDALMVAFFVKFVCEFLELKIYLTKWYRILEILYYTLLTLAGSVLISIFYFTEQLINITIALVLVTIIPVSFISLKNGYKPAKFFFIGTLLISITGMYHLIIEFGLMATNPVADTGYRITSLLLIWFFSQAVSERLGHFKSEKEKTELELNKSEEQLLLVIKGAHLCTWEWDILKNKTYHNKSWYDLLGLKYDKFKIEHDIWLDLLHPDDHDHVLNELNAHLEGKSDFYEAEYRLNHTSGEWIWVRDWGSVIERDQNGDPIRATGTMIDITRHKEAEATIRESENRHKMLFNSANDVFLIMKDDIIVECNEKALETFDCTRDQIIGKTPFDLSPPEQPDGQKSAEKGRGMIDAVLGGEAKYFEWKHITPAGRLFDVEVSLNRIQLKSGMHLQAVVRDVTKRKRTEYLFNVLREAGISLQEALTTDEIFKNVSTTLNSYDFQFTYFSINEKEELLVPVYLSYSKDSLKKAENVAGIKLEELEVKIDYAPEYQKVVNNQDVLFIKEPEKLLEKMLPDPANKFSLEVKKILDIPALILAPVIANSKTIGLISVQSNELQESDIAVISIFAQQFSGALNRAQHFEQVQTEIAIRKDAEIALKNSEEYFRTIIENSKDVIFIVDRAGRIVYESPSYEREFGFPAGESIGKSVFEKIHPDEQDRFKDQFNRIKKNSTHTEMIQMKHQKVDGTWNPIEGSITNLLKLKSVNGIVINFRDVTEGQRLQEQLSQSQKMEAIGQLAGGVAHDFNNLLTIISGYSYLLLMDEQFPEEFKAKLEEIEEASSRAEALTRQLLAFSRKQIVQPIIVDFNTTINDSIKMLRRLIGEDIQIKLELNDNLSPVLADPHQLQQILVNLIVNARDAIQTDTKLANKKYIIIETRNTYLDEEYSRTHTEVETGNYVELVISDTGVGMDKLIVDKIFEPFFTTKEQNKGTGLGLATVYGIVKQNNASIVVYSEPDQGTSFSIYWPVAESKISKVQQTTKSRVKKGSESILLVEDDRAVRDFSIQALESLGYKVYEAENGNMAIDLLKKKKLKPDLLITDIIMPGMDGKELSEKIKKLLPKARVIYTSGYTDNHIVTKGSLDKGIDFLEKPYSVSSLSSKVREVLDKK